MASDRATLLRYTIGASLAAAALFYVFGPSLVPNEGYQGLSKRGAVGLVNAGNDCFVNSVLQALAASAKLRKYLRDALATSCVAAQSEGEVNIRASSFEDLVESKESTSNEENLVTRALSQLLERLTDPSIKGQTISNKDFIRALERAFKARLSRRQQDAQELLQFVIEKLDDEARARESNCELNGKPHPAPFPIQGELQSQIECMHCHYQPTVTTSRFFVLSLNVPQQGNTSVDSCFDGLLKQEVIDDYICAKCKLQSIISAKVRQMASQSGSALEKTSKEVSDAKDALENDPEQMADDALFAAGHTAPRRKITKHTRIAKYPEILVVHLSRSLFASQSSKNTASVSFEMDLALGTADRHMYRLVSVVTHRGGHNSGHYETFRRLTHPQSSGQPQSDGGKKSLSSALEARKKMRRHHDQWWGISDAKVRSCDTQDILGLQRECYLLFYQKVH
ncbi:MAG: hypothetical protein Q9159_005419 [Coniocarpon cinnabarinum]